MDPKVLVISNTMFGDVNNMGRTLSNMFCQWEKGRIAQLAFQRDKITTRVCDRYFTITDVDAFKSIINRKPAGRALDNTESLSSSMAQLRKGGGTKAIFRYFTKRRPFGMFLRNTAWSMAKWKSQKLYDWIDEFAPDVIFFASGDYTFSYKIALEISKDKNIPLVTYCCDDFYINKGKFYGLLAKYNRWAFMRAVRSVMERSSAVVTICDKMTKAYNELFGMTKASAISTSSAMDGVTHEEKNNRIAFLGNISLGRHRQLMEIARAVIDIDHPNNPMAVDVYTGTTDPVVLDEIKNADGIRFMGRVSIDEVTKVMQEAMVVIHTESFDDANVERVRFSVSTKIADSMRMGTCMLAYGPRDVASMEYLRNEGAAAVASDKDELASELTRLICDEEYRKALSKRAAELGQNNHTVSANTQKLRQIIGSAVKD